VASAWTGRYREPVRRSDAERLEGLAAGIHRRPTKRVSCLWQASSASFGPPASGFRVTALPHLQSIARSTFPLASVPPGATSTAWQGRGPASMWRAPTAGILLVLRSPPLCVRAVSDWGCRCWPGCVPFLEPCPGTTPTY